MIAVTVEMVVVPSRFEHGFVVRLPAFDRGMVAERAGEFGDVAAPVLNNRRVVEAQTGESSAWRVPN